MKHKTIVEEHEISLIRSMIQKNYSISDIEKKTHLKPLEIQKVANRLKKI